jgi:REP element-mobilizing transposase RayT
MIAWSRIVWHRHSCLCQSILFDKSRHRPGTDRSVCATRAWLAQDFFSMKAFYRRNLPHLERLNAVYFVTFRTKGDLFLPRAARSIALRHVLFENGRRIELHAAVIMPNHVHLLLTAWENEHAEPYSLAEIMKGIKGTSAYKINRLLERRGQLWQDESFDRIMRSQEFEWKFNYICANPVDAGLRKRPKEYRWLWTEAQAGVPVPHE